MLTENVESDYISMLEINIHYICVSMLTGVMRQHTITGDTH